MRGLAYLQLGEPVKALKDFESAIDQPLEHREDATAQGGGDAADVEHRSCLARSLCGARGEQPRQVGGGDAGAGAFPAQRTQLLRADRGDNLIALFREADKLDEHLPVGDAHDCARLSRLEQCQPLAVIGRAFAAPAELPHCFTSMPSVCMCERRCARELYIPPLARR